MSPDQAQLLAMLVQILGAKRCIEVGVYTVCINELVLIIDKLALNFHFTFFHFCLFAIVLAYYP